MWKVCVPWEPCYKAFPNPSCFWQGHPCCQRQNTQYWTPTGFHVGWCSHKIDVSDFLIEWTVTEITTVPLCLLQVSCCLHCHFPMFIFISRPQNYSIHFQLLRSLPVCHTNNLLLVISITTVNLETSTLLLTDESVQVFPNLC